VGRHRSSVLILHTRPRVHEGRCSECYALKLSKHSHLYPVTLKFLFVVAGKGFTAPDEWEVGGRPFPFWQGVGRCANVTSCQTGPAPAGGIRDLADGESWCDSSVNGNGRVRQQTKNQDECEDPSLVPSTKNPCVDIGKGWGVCSRKGVCSQLFTTCSACD